MHIILKELKYKNRIAPFGCKRQYHNLNSLWNKKKYIIVLYIIVLLHIILINV